MNSEKRRNGKIRARQRSSWHEFLYYELIHGSRSSLAPSSTSCTTISSGSSLHDHSISYASDRSPLASVSSSRTSIGPMITNAVVPETKCAVATIPIIPSCKTETKFETKKQHHYPEISRQVTVNAISFRRRDTVSRAMSALVENSCYSRETPFSDQIQYKNYQHLRDQFPATTDRKRFAELEENNIRDILRKKEEKNEMRTAMRDRYFPQRQDKIRCRELMEKVEIREKGLSSEEKKDMRKQTEEGKLGHMEWNQDGYSFRQYVAPLKETPVVSGGQRMMIKEGRRKVEAMPTINEKNETVVSEVDQGAANEKSLGTEKDTVDNVAKCEASAEKTKNSSHMSVCDQMGSLKIGTPTPEKAKNKNDQKPNIFRRLFGGGNTRPVPQNNNVDELVEQWHRYGPVMNDLHREMESHVSPHFAIASTDLEDMRTPNTWLSSVGLWYPLFREVVDRNNGTRSEDQYTLVHPDFIFQHYGRSGVPAIPMSQTMPEYTVFENTTIRRRVLMPVRLVNAPHYVLVAMGMDSEGQVRVHIMDSIQSDQPPIPENQLIEIAQYFFGSSSTVRVEIGRLDREVQEQGVNDCGVHTILNSLRYLHSRHRDFGCIMRRMPLESTHTAQRIIEVRKRYADYMEHIYRNVDHSLFGHYREQIQINADDQMRIDDDEYVATVIAEREPAAVCKGVSGVDDVPEGNSICKTPTSRIERMNSNKSRNKKTRIQKAMEVLSGRIATDNNSSDIHCTPRKEDCISSPNVLFASPGLSTDFAGMDLLNTPTNTGPMLHKTPKSDEMKGLAANRWEKTRRKSDKQRQGGKQVRRKLLFEIDPDKMTDLEYLTGGMKTLKNFVDEEIDLVVQRVKEHLFLNLDGPPNESTEMRKKRQLCKVPIHMCPKSATLEERRTAYRPVTENFYRSFRMFMGYFDIRNIDDMNENEMVVDRNRNVDMNIDEDSFDDGPAHVKIVHKTKLDANISGSSDNIPIKNNVDETCANLNPISSPKVDRERFEDVLEEIDNPIGIGEEVEEVRADDENIVHDEEERESTHSQNSFAEDSNDEEDIEYIIKEDDNVQLVDEPKELDAREVRLKKAAKVARLRSAPPLYDIRDVQDLMMDAHGEVVLRDIPADDEYGQELLNYMTLTRMCDDKCPKVDVSEAALVHDAIAEKISKTVTKTTEFVYSVQGQNFLIMDWIENYMECYQGLRSLKRRLDDLRRLIAIQERCNEVSLSNNIETMRKFLTVEDFPLTLRIKFLERHAKRASIEHHRQGSIEVTHGASAEAFKNAMKQLETEICDVCLSFKPPKYMFKIAKEKCGKKIDPTDSRLASKPILDICAMCKKKDGMPGAATANNFMPRPIPPELACLNAIERMLIQQFRPNQKVFVLKNVSNNPTPMRGTRGVLSVLPTQITASLDHVERTLPSGSSLIIDVRPPWGNKYLVSLEKIIIALRWLKANNQCYKDIIINENFTFTVDENVFFNNKDATQKDADKLVGRTNVIDEDDPNYWHLLTQAFIEEQPIQPMHQRNDSELAHVKFFMKKHRWCPTSAELPNLDVMCFPELHPYGDDGLNAIRITEVKVAKYVRTVLLHSDRRWATSVGYMCFMYGRKQQLYITSVQGIQARVQHGTKFMNFDLYDENNQKRMSSAYAKCRGFPQYWKSVKYDLRAHVAAFGTPTWFLTLNPNVKEWLDLHEHYRVRTGMAVNEENIEEVIARDPVIFARYWKLRVDSFFRLVLLNPNGPLGRVTHRFHRVEYQHRGTEHIHCLLWTADRPAANASSDEVRAFIDTYLTARLPDPNTEKELYDLVDVQQRHWEKHSNTCRRKVKVRGQWTTTRCRFGFPRPETRTTIVYGEETKRCNIPGVSNRPYYVARTADETHINEYNPGCLLIWKSNMDLQYIPADATEVVNYVTSYTTKGEKAKRLAQSNLDRYALESASPSKFLFKIGKEMADQREAGQLEIADDLLGHQNYSFDIAHVNVPNDPKDKRMRVLKPLNQIRDDDDVIHQHSMLDSYYPNRPKILEQHSLYNIMGNFHMVSAKSGFTEKRSKSQKIFPKTKGEEAGELDEEEEENLPMGETIGDDRYHINELRSPFFCHPKWAAGHRIELPKRYGMCFRKRKQHLPRFYLPQLVYENVELVEDYHRRLVIVFVPWRDEERILEEHGVTTYSELWMNFLEYERKHHYTAYQDIKLLLEGYTRLQNQEAELGKWMDQIRRAKAASTIDEEAEEHLEIHAREVNRTKHEEDVLLLNEIQFDIYDTVIRRLAEQEEVKQKNEEIKRQNAIAIRQNKPRIPLLVLPEPLLMYIAGVAGAGKSFLINTIADAISLLYATSIEQLRVSPPTMLSGPTGVSAIAIGGNTVHSVYGIEVVQALHRAEEEFLQLSNLSYDMKKYLFSQLRLGITDEISMISNIIFMKMHRRSQEISGKNDIFGGYNMILFGDLMQLPPVRGPPIFETLSSSMLRRIFGTIDTRTNLWQNFEYRELTQNMRQGKSGELADMFERIRTGRQTRNDIRVLESRRIMAENPADPTMNETADAYIKLLEIDPHAMALFPTNAEVNDLNRTVMDRINLNDSVTIRAHDSIDSVATRKFNRWREGQQAKPWQRVSYTKPKNRIWMNYMDGSISKDPSKEIQGGLPAELTIAVGARVMLRRNVSVRNRLVNGATGVVHEIKRNVHDGLPEVVYVAFDGMEEPVAINKERASYMHAGQMMIRVQFPLVVSYGATIHKAQGLTLRVVLVRTRNIFAPGSFYVAITRVTTLEGLHLAGFSEDVIKYSITALNECNRLRATIGLPEIEGGPGGVFKDFKSNVCAKSDKDRNQNKKVVKSKNDQSSTVVAVDKVCDKGENDDAMEIDDAFAEQKREALQIRKKTRKQRLVYERRLIAEDIHRLIPNAVPIESMSDNRFCEAILLGLVYALPMMEFVSDAIVGFDEEKIVLVGDAEDSKTNPLKFNIVRECLLQNTRDVWELGHEWNASVHHVADTEAVVDLFFEQALPKQIVDMFSRRLETKIRCENCKSWKIVNSRRTVLWIPEDVNAVDLPMHINKYLSSKTECYHADDCEEIGGDGENCGGSMIYYDDELGTDSRYLIVGLRHGFNNSAYKPLPVDPFTIGGAKQQRRFLIAGAVKFGNLVEVDAEPREVEAWYRNPVGGWIQVTPGGEHAYRDEIQLRGFNLFVFVEKPKERLTAADRKKLEEEELETDNFDIVRVNVEDEIRPLQKLVGPAAAVQTNGPQSYVLLDGSGNKCFLNVAINMLYNCTEIRELVNLSTEPNSSNSCNYLRQIFNGQQMGARLRETLPKELRGTKQNDSGEAIGAILQIIGNDIDLMSLRKIATLREVCDVCGTRETAVDSLRTFLSFGYRSETFQQQLDRTQRNIVVCDVCGGRRTISEEVHFHGTHHFVVTTDRRSFPRFRVNESVRMFDAEWDLICFAEHVGDERGGYGHYYSWIKQNNCQWVKISDDRVVDHERHDDFQLGNRAVNVLLFRQRTPLQSCANLPLVAEDVMLNEVNVVEMEEALSTVSTNCNTIRLKRKNESYPRFMNSEEKETITEVLTAVEHNSAATPSPPPEKKSKTKFMKGIIANGANVITNFFNVAGRTRSATAKAAASSPSVEACKWIKPKKGVFITSPLTSLPLMNPTPHTSCFLISALNMIFACSNIREDVVNFSGYKGPHVETSALSTPVTNDVVSIFMGYINSVEDLRLKMKGFETGYGDVNKVLERLIQIMWKEIEEDVRLMTTGSIMFDSILIGVRDRLTCTCCNNETVKEVKIRTVLHVKMTPGKTLEECVAGMMAPKTAPCKKCGNGEATKVTAIQTRIHLIIAIDVVENGTGNARLRNFDRNEVFVLFNKKEYRLIAYSEYDEKKRHYLSWIRMGDERWLRVDDSVTSYELSNGSGNNSILVLEKLDQKGLRFAKFS